MIESKTNNPIIQQLNKLLKMHLFMFHFVILVDVQFLENIHN